MMLCEAIGCPHVDLLEEYGITWERLVDWHAFYLWKLTPAQDETSAKEKIEELKTFKELFDEA